MPSEYEIEIVDFNAIDGGIEVFARAWLNGVQVGFGIDGSVDIERFRIFNPPIMVADGTTHTVTPSDGIGEPHEVDNFKEDPQEAVLQTLIHTIKQIGKDGSNIIAGKIGNTVSTFYPSSDSSIYLENATWSTVHDGTSGTLYDSGGLTYLLTRHLSAKYHIWRFFMVFDTSALPDTDNISDAVLSVYTTVKGGTASHAYNIYGSTCSTTVTGTDFDLCDAVPQCDTEITHASLATGAYNNYTLNATGRGNISKTSLSKFVYREAYKDAGNVAPDTENNTYFELRSMDFSGTASDPKLVVTHSAGGGSTFTPRAVWFT